MCNKHSFLFSENSKIYHGYGIFESHTLIASLHGINEDRCNKYEYDPPRDHCSYGIKGLKIDSEVFVASKQQIDIIENYIKEMFPDQEAFDNYSKFDTLPETLELIETLDRLSKDEDWCVRLAVAENENTSPETLDRLSKDKNWCVRLAVAGNENTSPETLDRLSKDEDWYVCKAAAKNKKL